jgi:hypothetical protein
MSSVLGYLCRSLIRKMKYSRPNVTYASERGVIFFSSTSSSTNSFLYFSQLLPVALGIIVWVYD